MVRGAELKRKRCPAVRIWPSAVPRQHRKVPGAPSASEMFTGSGGRSTHGLRGYSVLEAQYYYQYVAGDGKLVRIAEGDRFVLLQKSNQDWWQVRRQGEPKKAKPIYVPAAYVVELPMVTAAGKRASLPRKFAWSSLEFSDSWPRAGSDDNPKYKRSTFGGLSGFRQRRSEGDLCRPGPLDPEGRGVRWLKKAHPLTPNPYQRQGVSVAAMVHSWPPRGEQVEQRGQADGATDGEGPAEPEAESADSSPPPVYSNLKELKLGAQAPPSPTGPPAQVMDLWERHVDPVTGRSFYLNAVTKERTWKPPRRARGRAVSRSSTPPPDYPTTWNGDGTSTSSCSHLESLQQDRKSWDSSQLPRCSSSETLGSSTYNASGVQLRDRRDSASRPGQARSMIIVEKPEAKATHRRNLSQHSFCVSMSESSPVSSPTEEKAGLLNKTKIAEGGRKLRKNWSSSWVVLAGNSLAFYKEAKSQGASTKKPVNRPESSMDLRGSLIEWTREMSSKKNVFRIRTVTGNEFLLQSENEDYISDWYKTIKNVIDTLDRENPLDYPLVYSLRRTASAELLDCSGEEDEVPVKEKHRESRRISLRRMNSDSSERKRVKNRIRKFITKRPPLQTLQEKGLIKDQVFGCRLDALCEREKATVPKFVRLCIEAVEKRGLDVDGIYRVSGNLAVIQKLRFVVDHERAVTTDGRYLFPEELCQEEKLNMDDPEWEDVHVITGALKMFFRELPEPLFPYDTFEGFVSAVKLPDHSERLENVRNLVQNLPRANRDTMKTMFQHMKKVAEHSHLNRMTAQSLAIVFGPTLLRPEKDFLNMAVHMVYQNQIVELILLEYQAVFASGREPL
ncbi:rho GTPase-activating protein 15 [Carcharodon carcharias]|uniref:rho GTPase-activating protein 15 n=1 Tax=Carcharodon carcharias TaxID=13397 RepID=UPI001B7F53F8|nr:rho GTPase-activating protein 15 [Carcharodon carcharias]